MDKSVDPNHIVFATDRPVVDAACALHNMQSLNRSDQEALLRAMRESKKKEALPNPGRLEELKKEASGVLSPDVFEGARFEFNKTLTSKFALLHNVALAGGQAGSYEFGAHFGDESTLLASRIDMQGRLNGRLNAQLTGARLFILFYRRHLFSRET